VARQAEDHLARLSETASRFKGIGSAGGEFQTQLELAVLAIALKRRLIVIQAVEHAQMDETSLSHSSAHFTTTATTSANSSWVSPQCCAGSRLSSCLGAEAFDETSYSPPGKSMIFCGRHTDYVSSVIV
jgi:hypothetical protein